MTNISDAKRLLETAAKECQDARTVMDAQGDYATAKQDVQAACDKLAALPVEQQEVVAEEVESVRKKLAEAIRLAETEKKPGDAMPLLADCQKKANKAVSKAGMHANLHQPDPNNDFIKLLMEESGGVDALDDIVRDLDESTSRNVLGAALECRFDLEMQQFLSQDTENFGTADNTAPDKSVKRIYELMRKVPESHARDNPKVERIRRFQEDKGGAAYGWGEIDLNCGRAGAEGSDDVRGKLASAHYFPDGVEEDCLPPEGTEDKEVRYFDWATLHEVGHAVDDNKNFMDRNQEDTKYGGWRVYGADVSEPAAAAQGKFKYDLAYIEGKLRGESPDAVDKPDDEPRTDQQWADAKAAVDKWCASVMALNLWWNGAESKNAAIEGRVYQLAYKTPKWVSYELDARKRGIHGYQFRAPGEWFAELYAAYYMGMLKPEHPACKDWLPSRIS